MILSYDAMSPLCPGPVIDAVHFEITAQCPSRHRSSLHWVYLPSAGHVSPMPTLCRNGKAVRYKAALLTLRNCGSLDLTPEESFVADNSVLHTSVANSINCELNHHRNQPKPVGFNPPNSKKYFVILVRPNVHYYRLLMSSI